MRASSRLPKRFAVVCRIQLTGAREGAVRLGLEEEVAHRFKALADCCEAAARRPWADVGRLGIHARECRVILRQLLMHPLRMAICGALGRGALTSLALTIIFLIPFVYYVAPPIRKHLNLKLNAGDSI
jgi:hypothetical protein